MSILRICPQYVWRLRDSKEIYTGIKLGITQLKKRENALDDEYQSCYEINNAL